MTTSNAAVRLIMQRELLRRQAVDSFWSFCQAIAPEFYRQDRQYLIDFCDTLEGIYRGTIRKNNGDKYKGALISFPPRHGKSRTLTLFSAWLLGRHPDKSIIGVGYNSDMGQTFSKHTRSIIAAEPNAKTIVFSDIFPNVKLKFGDSNVKNWSLEGSPHSYLGTGFGGTITGKGASLALVIDDPVKNADEAFSEERLDSIYETYTDTLKSRVEEGGLLFIVQTRWSKKDLVGRILDSPEASDYYVVNYKAYDEVTDTMLCESVLSRKSYESLRAVMSDIIFLANYQQSLIDKKGGLYVGLEKNIYNAAPDYNEYEKVVAYVDVATSGTDYFATIIAGIKDNIVYVLDCIYTQENIDVTEPLLVSKLSDARVVECVIESNSAGGIFANNVKKELKKQGIPTIVRTHNQSKNKETRLVLNAPYVVNNVFFASDFKLLHGEAWEHLLTFKMDVKKNKHDDIEDALTGLIEHFIVNASKSRKSRAKSIGRR